MSDILEITSGALPYSDDSGFHVTVKLWLTENGPSMVINNVPFDPDDWEKARSMIDEAVNSFRKLKRLQGVNL